jgi:ferrous iron transport protein A
MRTLDSLKPGETGIVAALKGEGDLTEGLAEAGFEPGCEVEILARGLFGGTPLSVRLGRTIVALRRDEAQAVTLT